MLQAMHPKHHAVLWMDRRWHTGRTKLIKILTSGAWPVRLQAAQGRLRNTHTIKVTQLAANTWV